MFHPNCSSDYPCYVLAPQTDRLWDAAHLENIKDVVAALPSVDMGRIYILGHSMGGAGSWNAVWAAPDRFAAAIPSAGGLLPWKDPAKFKNVPIWAFHGGSDPVVPTDFSREIFARIKQVGGNLKYTELKGVKHNASQYAFSYEGDEPDKGYVTQYSSESCDRTANVWDWLFAQRLDGRYYTLQGSKFPRAKP